MNQQPQTDMDSLRQIGRELTGIAGVFWGFVTILLALICLANLADSHEVNRYVVCTSILAVLSVFIGVLGTLRLTVGRKAFLSRCNALLIVGFVAGVILIADADSRRFYHQFDIVEQCVAGLESLIRGEQRFQSVKVRASTERGGSVQVDGHVENGQDANTLRELIEAGKPASVPLKWHVKVTSGPPADPRVPLSQ
jgi:hypothetical protein